MAFELTKDLPTKISSIKTPLETVEARVLARQIVLVAILRAGLGMQNAFLKIFPEAAVGHLGFYRNEETLEPVKYYEKLPNHLPDSEIILSDPMLATGGSLNASLDLLKEYGAKKIKCAILVAAPQGVEFIFKNHPDITIYIAALDRDLNKHGFILPGLGDAGDRLYGTG